MTDSARVRPLFLLWPLALLASCGGWTGTPRSPRPHALVYGAVSSPVFDALRSRLDLTPGDATSDPGAASVVILDGDNFTGAQIAQDPFITRAVHSGAWVIGVDMAEDDKKAGMQQVIGAATPHASGVYMVRQSRRQDHSLVYTIVDLPTESRSAEQSAQQIAALLHSPVLSDPDDPSGPVPPRLINVTYRLVRTLDFGLPGNKNPVFPGRPQQQAAWTVTHSVRLFLDAGTNPQGDFQHVLLTTWGSANPGAPVSNTKDACSDFNDQCELAWIQTRFDTAASFVAASGLTLLQSSPANVNNEETVTTGSTFTVGYSQDSGVNASYSYSDTTTKTITDWQALNRSTSNAANWTFASNHPYNGLVSSGYDDSMWFYYFDGVAPASANTLSTTNFQYATQAHWTNEQVSRDVLTISGTDNAYHNDTWTVRDNNDDDPKGNNPHCVWYICEDDPAKGAYGLAQHWFQNNDAQPWSLDIDMSAVIPVRTQSLTFSPNPVVAGQPTTATLALASMTPVDAVIRVRSDKSGIAPEHDTYLIPAGQDSLTFTVHTGPQGCQPQSATLTAFYAEDQNAVLSVTPPDSCP